MSYDEYNYYYKYENNNIWNLGLTQYGKFAPHFLESWFILSLCKLLKHLVLFAIFGCAGFEDYEILKVRMGC